MAVLIHISHTGQTLAFDEQDGRLEVVRSWIERNASIPASRQILMSARGRNLKNLINEDEAFVYDKRYLSPNSIPPTSDLQELQVLSDLPSSASNENDLQSWRELFMSHRTWAINTVETFKKGLRMVDSLAEETSVITRSISAAVDNLNNHLNNVSQKFGQTEEWALGRLQEHKDVLKDIDSGLNLLSELPVREDVANILRKQTESSRPIHTLHDLVHITTLEEAESTLDTLSQDFEERFQHLQSSMKTLKNDAMKVNKHASQEPDLDTAALLEEAETLAKRISSDYEDVLKMADNSKLNTTVTKKAATHARDLLPALQAIDQELRQGLAVVIQSRSAAAHSLFQVLQEISQLQSRLAKLQASISQLDLHDSEHMSILLRVFDLPSVYGCTLIEAIRRSEWTQHMQKDVDEMHNDLSQLTEEEQRRRKKWANLYSDFLNTDMNAIDPLIDIRASKPRNAWPFVNRDEIFAWIDDLRALNIDQAVQEITQRLKDLDAPVRKARPRGSKTGSAQDVTQSTTLPNNEELRALQDDKTRLEDRLRSSDSRIRKLEDLLYRQNQVNRSSSGTFVPGSAADFERTPTSPNPLMRPHDSSRRSSVSRRLSTTQDEKSMAQRIVSLEAQVHKLQDEAHAERRSSSETRIKMEEAESVKQDLMANFDAQRQEFDDERLLIDDENRKLRVRLEELEDELDRVLGSRDHMKQTQNQAILDTRTELEQLRKTFEGELEQAQRKLENYRKDVNTQRERAATLERQVHQIREERSTAQNQNVTLANQLRNHEEQRQDFTLILQGVHANLSPAGSPPEDMRRLVNALEILSEGAAIHARGLDDTLQLIQAENKSQEGKIAHNETQIKDLKEKLSKAETRTINLNEILEHERGKLAALQAELVAEQEQSSNLRAKFAAGETGSDALREQLSAEEKKVSVLLHSKIDQEATIQNLRHEIETLMSGSKVAMDNYTQLRQRLESRGHKAKQLSEKLFQHNDRIIRMLEQFGYSISRQDDKLVIQRASKVNASTILFGGDGGSSMRRTVSGGAPVQHYADPTDLETLYWTSDIETVDEDKSYQCFLDALQRLDLDATIDMITKRYKDVENLAKKYQKDSRAYREKSHRLQSEAHEKIAYRSFKEGDLALFLPTRNQATRPWAAFNVGAPHYFLREQDGHKLPSRDWLLARISKVEERVVDLSRSLARGSASMNTELSDNASARSVDDENPFELSDGLRWYMIDASEEKPGAPGTPSVGKSTVIASNIEVKGNIGRGEKSKATSGGIGGGGTSTSIAPQVTKTLVRSLDSRRSSSNSKKSFNISPNKAKGSSDANTLKDTTGHLAPITSDPGVPEASTSEAQSQHHQQQNTGQLPTILSSDGDLKSSKEPAREDASVFQVGRNPNSNQDRGWWNTSVHPQTMASGDHDARNRSISPAKRDVGSAAIKSLSGNQQHQQNQQQGMARMTSPAKSAGASTQSLLKQPPIPSPAKSAKGGGGSGSGSGTGGRAWDKLFSVEWNG